MDKFIKLIFILLSFQLCLITHSETNIVKFDSDVTETLIESNEKNEKEANFLDDFVLLQEIDTFKIAQTSSILSGFIQAQSTKLKLVNHIDSQISRGPPHIS